MASLAPPPLKFYPTVVGINHYRASTSAQSFDLACAVQDAQRVSDFLRAGNPAFQVVQFQPFMNEQATAENIRSALRQQWGSQRLGKGDVLFFYFAGHGMVTPDGRAFLCCYDTNFRDPNSGGLRLDDLFGDMQGIPALRGVTAETVMVLLDACYSGSVVDPGIVNHHPAQYLQAALSNMLPQTINHRIIISAAHADQKAREKHFPDGGSGVFTHALLEGWGTGKARTVTGLITPHTLAEYIQQEFAANRRQKPMIAITGGDVLVIGRFAAPVADARAGAAGSGHISAPYAPPPQIPSPLFNPEKGRKLPVQQKPPPPPRQELLVLAGAAGMALALLVACALLVAFSPFFFAAGFGVACLFALVSVAGAGRFWLWAGILTLLQAVLLVGVAHQRFGLAAGWKVLDSIDQFAWLALCIFFAQAFIILYRSIRFVRRRA